MRIRRSIRTFAATGLAACAAGVAGPAVAQADPHLPPPSNPTVARANQIINLSWRDFAVTPHVAPYDWSADGCSPPTPSGDAAFFRRACNLHDFGYRNYGHGLALGRNEDVRNYIDNRFHTEMNNMCDTVGGAPFGCKFDAEVIYGAVRNGGRGAFYG